jgi:alpha-methylacyl-CoA racemase
MIGAARARGMGSGPLAGLRVLEFAAIGPVPYCGMLFSDMGADVLRIDRPGAQYDRYMVETRGRRSLVLDLKQPRDLETALRLAGKADVLLEGLRPGVMERLGIGPDVALARNPKLVYGRMTGWGQQGPYAKLPGHDINFVAISGALHAIGTPERPVPPVNLVGDFGGGALHLAVGILAALRHVQQGGPGQVIDCAMSDGTAALMGMLYGHLARGSWKDERGANIIDGGAPFYGVYRCADGAWIAIGAIEPQFFSALVSGAGLDPAWQANAHDPSTWPDRRVVMEKLFATRPRAEWLAMLEHTEACVVPVSAMSEAPLHAHNRARGTFTTVDEVVQPAPVPRFSATPSGIRHGPVGAGEGGTAALADWDVERA